MKSICKLMLVLLALTVQTELVAAKEVSCKNIQKAAGKNITKAALAKLMKIDTDAVDGAALSTLQTRIGVCVEERKKKLSSSKALGGFLKGAAKSANINLPIGGSDKQDSDKKLQKLMAMQVSVNALNGGSVLSTASTQIEANTARSDVEPFYRNKSASTAICIAGDMYLKTGGRRRQDVYEQQHACLPDNQLAKTNHFTVKDLTLPVTVEGFENCKLLSEIVDIQIGEQNIGIYFTAICSLNGNPAKMTIEATEEAYWIKQIDVPVCGPNLNVEGSDWDARVRARYNVDADDISQGYGSSGLVKYHAEFAGENQLSETITVAKTGKYSDFESYLTCDANAGQSIWDFSIQNTSEAIWHTHVSQFVASKQKGDDF